MTSKLLGSGYATPFLLLDIAVAFCITCIVNALLVPVIRLYKQGKRIDQSIGSDQGHWFYGHLFKVSCHFITCFLTAITCNKEFARYPCSRTLASFLIPFRPLSARYSSTFLLCIIFSSFTDISFKFLRNYFLRRAVAQKYLPPKNLNSLKSHLKNDTYGS